MRESGDTDALVVGGGLAGSSLAITLARAGKKVTLVEKSRAAHPKVCGEFLSHEALHYLDRLGVDPGKLGAVPIKTVRLAAQGIVACAQLPFTALSLSRQSLDEALLQRAAQVGATVHRGQRADSLEHEGAGWRLVMTSGARLTAGTAFLATGKHDMHGWARPPGRQNGLLAFKMYWRLAPAQSAALDSSVELILFPGGYAGLQPVEHGAANLCLLVEETTYRAAGGSWPALLAHLEGRAGHLAMRLAGAQALWERPLGLSSIPYGYVRAHAEDGLWRLGDQSAVIPSFAGDGMSIALHSAQVAARVYLSGGTAAAYQGRLARHVRRQVGLATRASQALVHLPNGVKFAVRLAPFLLAAISRSTRIRRSDLLD